MTTRPEAPGAATVPEHQEPGGSPGPGGDDRPSFYLHPGKIFVSAEPRAAMTILGSCVAVCLWDPLAAAGGLAHFVLPHGAGTGPSALRFGDRAVPELIGQLLGLGCKGERLQAKLFGGASMIAALLPSGGRLGFNNVDVARQLLSAAGIPLLAEDVGGQRGRKLIFHVDDGDAWVKVV